MGSSSNNSPLFVYLFIPVCESHIFIILCSECMKLLFSVFLAEEAFEIPTVHNVPWLFCVPLCVKGRMRAHKQLCRMSHVFCIIYQSKRHFIAHIFLSLNCSERPQSFVHVYSLKKHIIALILLTSLLYNLRYFVPGLLAGGGALWACSRLPLSSRGWVPCNVAETARECSVSMFASLWPV